MKDLPLTDTRIAAVVKIALDNNAAIVQYCSFIYGQSSHVSSQTRKKWHKDLLKQWKLYQEEVLEILGAEDEQVE